MLMRHSTLMRLCLRSHLPLLAINTAQLRYEPHLVPTSPAPPLVTFPGNLIQLNSQTTFGNNGKWLCVRGDEAVAD
jgi:hypothetical protein